MNILGINSKRIAWIDVAKGIAILLVIIGHTVKYGSGTRDVIFSFHMPLFLILSGYAFRLSSGFSSFVQRVKKLIQHLIYPSVIVSIISIFVRWIINGQHTFLDLWTITNHMGDALRWGSGVPVHAHPGLGMLWFLISLFWAKVFMDGIHLFFPGKKTGYIFVGIGLFGMALGVKGKWLPQNMDVTFLVILFLYIGMLWRKYQNWLECH